MNEDERTQKQQEELEASKKVAQIGAKAIATAYFGKEGGKAVDVASKTKLGNKALNRAGKKINKNPLSRAITKKASDSGLLDSTSLSDVKVFLKIKMILKLAVILLPILALSFVVVYFLLIIDELTSKGDTGMAVGGYYSPECTEITVIFTDKSKNYEVTGSGTYDLEEYVAGVIAGEVGYFGNLEVDKAFAIAARSYGLSHVNNCTIESSDRKQVFRELTDSPNDALARQAAEETAGQVLLSGNSLTSSQYDAFACIDKDNNYYTIAQANQKVPIDWIDARINKNNKPNWFICNGRENLSEHHGNGMSQFGSWYLASELNYDYQQILAFYLDDVTISTKGFTSSITGLTIKDTSNASELHESLSTFLPSRGSSVDELNAFIKNKVVENGAGTRAGAVTAAVSLINYLYDNGGVKIPYYWNGKYNKIGINPNYGGYTTPSAHGQVYAGFDCSGFVTWSITNGGYNFSSHSTKGFNDEFYNDSCPITDQSCIGQPGDLINSYGSGSNHVQLIVSVDEASNTYYIAESSGSLVMIPVSMHSSRLNDARIIHMDNYYNNSSNVNANY